MGKKDLNVYFVGDPGYEVKLSDQFNHYLFKNEETKLTSADLANTNYTGINFVDVDSKEQYDTF